MQTFCLISGDQSAAIPLTGDVPSTYGIPGVELVGGPGMKLFSELTCYQNPGRKELTSSQVSDLVDILETEGIRPDRGSMGYYDVDDDSNVNSITRQHASASLGIPGWMFQGVRFENALAKAFANASNWVDKTYNRQPNPKDVQNFCSQNPRRIR